MKSSLRNLQSALNNVLEDKDVTSEEITKTLRLTLSSSVDRHRYIATKAESCMNDVESSSCEDYERLYRPWPYFTEGPADSIGDTITFNNDTILNPNGTITNPKDARQSIA